MLKEFLISSLIHSYKLSGYVEDRVFYCCSATEEIKNKIMDKFRKMQEEDSYFNNFNIVFEEE